MTTDDDEAFRAFVETRRAELVRTAVMLTAGDGWMAEDLVQTALTRLYVSWSRVNAEKVDAYARRCLLNALVDHRRRSSTRRERPHDAVPEAAVSDPVAIDDRSIVFGALATLAPRMRAAVVMRHLLDLSVEETADALRCRTGTVKSQTARGLDQLRAVLEGDGVAVNRHVPAAPSDDRSPGPAAGVPATRTMTNL